MTKKKLKVIDWRLRAVGGEVVLRDKWYSKGSQGIETQFPGARQTLRLRDSSLNSYTSQWLSYMGWEP